MAENFYLDEPALDSVADGILVTGTNFTSAYKDLDGVLTATQGCWGDDEIGKAFEKNYWENGEKVWTGTEGAGEGLTETSKNMKKSAANLSSVDEETAKWLDSQIEEE
ncbi:hypothetical protein [Actinophytocola oryzae]|uniref:Uncharacterized protein n=1 Tax=Actinophytocola oryzae TaxID=502181 RepID=A0A4R7V124_9PSEU|nr:hypothetical protein [Actinophytocola oryzae]TDV42172.1 hypothetical protein CLV71_11842 [Actinophytocola oryzae]